MEQAWMKSLICPHAYIYIIISCHWALDFQSLSLIIDIHVQIQLGLNIHLFDTPIPIQIT